MLVVFLFAGCDGDGGGDDDDATDDSGPGDDDDEDAEGSLSISPSQGGNFLPTSITITGKGFVAPIQSHLLMR